MPQLHLLGTGSALSDPHRTTTMLALEDDTELIVIDCGGDAVQRLMQLGVDLSKLSALIITHEHADHVSGFPLFMEKLWLAGRRDPVRVYGIPEAVAQAKRLHDSFDLESWYDSGYPGVTWHEFALGEKVTVLESSFRVYASPAVHAVPNVGLRLEHNLSGKVIAYSGDTEPTRKFTDLALGADVLIHEATGEEPGHSSALAAAKVARDAHAKRLLLVHLPPKESLGEEQMAEALSVFANTEKGTEASTYEV